MKEGHSNIYVNKLETWPDNPDIAKIPQEGGTSLFTCQELPPLALTREEWTEIGRRMNWQYLSRITPAHTAANKGE